MTRLHVDEHEFAYLKAISLFSPDQPGLVLRRQVEKMQEKSFQALRNHVNRSSPDDNDRFPKLLLRITPLQSLEPQIIEELFFASLMGQVQIDSVIPYILKMGGSRPVKSEHLEEFMCK